MRNPSSLRVTCGVLLLCAGAFVAACDSKTNNLVDDDAGNGGPADAGIDFTDADPLAPDAAPSAGCVTGGTQCNDCVDNDGDGLTDGFDPECTGIADNDEGSFATGISGDNVDAKTQDCFFDGNSGGGDDKCAYHTCCLTHLNDPANCPISSPHFDPAECTVTQNCINNCGKLTPPGCDCFGCCTICDADSCRDVAINPAISPDCQLETLDDPVKCQACTKNTDCTSEPCGGTTCILCPGQLPEDLPAECNMTQQCPAGSTICTTTADCTGTDWCSVGCCIAQIG